MKYLLNLSININSALDSLNLRGEGRWEYNTLNALLQNNKQVHTTRSDVWRLSELRPDNLYNGMNTEWLDESVLLVHSAGPKLYIETDKACGYMTQFHEPPRDNARTEFLQFLSQNRIVATVASYNPHIFHQIANISGAENIYRMSGAMVPSVDESADNFRKPYITWSYRNFWDFVEQQPQEIKTLLEFFDSCVQKEPQMKLAVIVGLWNSSLGLQPTNEEIRNWALQYPVMQQFKHLWNNIEFHVNLHWHQVIDILKETRYIVSPAEPLGCPPYEAAMFGIPTIVNDNVNPFMTLDRGKLFPELLTSPRTIRGKFINTLERLQNDYDFYKKTGNAYMKFTNETATFKAYVEQLEQIVKERGWYK